ncbi:hypothetical protein AO067_16535 [Pseudomonas viridiflava ICMP 13104]|uniref:Uncharacterized protein n=1 Tax=Pseudomonas viridiflava ICMP 13104 TaxID=1198305 RepID=A0A0W0H950_PSEVI|nr:hypothetical protein AO067_16535 [Pseudomonas viridiflava ICMP 13104]
MIHHQYFPKFSGLAQNCEGYGGRPSVAGFIEDLKEFGDKAGDSVGDRKGDRKSQFTGVLIAPVSVHTGAYGEA